MLRCVALAGVLLCLTAGSAAATPAGGGPAGSDPAFPHSTVTVSITGPEQADSALTIDATGTNLARDQGLRTVPYGLELIVTDPDILPGACATSEPAELTRIATVRGGGSLLTYDDLPEGTGGRFTLREPYEPVGSGSLQVCAYSRWNGQDAAWAQANTQIAPAPVRPRSLARPRIRRSHDLLLCSRGRWGGAPTRFEFRWRVGSGRFGPARRGARYVVTARDRGRTASCEVVASGAGGTATATSRGVRIPG